MSLGSDDWSKLGRPLVKLNVGQSFGLFSLSVSCCEQTLSCDSAEYAWYERLIAHRVCLSLCIPWWRRQVKRQSYRFIGPQPVLFRVFSVFCVRTASFVARCIYTIFLVTTQRKN